VHRYFADWYRMAAIEPHGDLLQKRWEAIEGVVYAAEVPDTLELVRVFYGSPRKTSRFVERYRDAFKACDLTFPMRDNDAELRVLAGATLVALLHARGGVLADVAALAIVSGDCRGLRPGDRAPDMLQEARRHLAARSADLRAPRTVKPPSAPKLDVDALLEPLRTAAQARQTRDPGFEGMLEPLHAPGPAKPGPSLEIVSDAIRAIAAAVSDVAGAASRSAEEQGRRLQLYQEQNNILWWLVGEHSRDLGRRMGSLPLPGACLVAGKELADLTEGTPGPLAAAGVLDRMLRAVEPDLRASTTIQEAVNGTPPEWRESWAADVAAVEGIEDLCPVIASVRRSLDSHGPDDWAPAIRKLTGIDVAGGVSPLDVAFQTYEERLLLAALRSSA
jgi:GTPase-associated system-like protein